MQGLVRYNDSPKNMASRMCVEIGFSLSLFLFLTQRYVNIK